MERRKLLITGCGRSGTMYASAVWRSQGLDISHENPTPPNGQMGKDGIASWYMAVNDLKALFGPSASEYEFDFVIHQVRHPLKVIASVAQFVLRDALSRDYIERNAPETRLNPRERQMPDCDQLILQASRYWLYWNLLACEKSSLTIKVEDLAASVEELCARLNIAFVPGVAETVSANTHGRYLYINDPYWTVDWDDIARLDRDLCNRIRALAEVYGY